MINQQLVDFIKSQLSKGVDKETITKELLGGGWTSEDIEEGYSLADAKIINLKNSSAPFPPTITAESYNKGKMITIASSVLIMIIATNLIFGDEIGLMKDNLIKSIKGSKAEIIDQIKKEDIKTEIQQNESSLDQTQQSEEHTNFKEVSIQNQNIINKKMSRPVIVPDSYEFPDDKNELDKLSSTYCNKDKNDPMCISIKSFITNNVELCNSITDAELKYYCVLSVNPSSITPELCDSISLYAPGTKVYSSGVNVYNGCYSELANQTLNIKYCKNRINVMNTKDTIDNYCLTNIALINNSIEPCNEIIKNTDRYQCLTQLAVKNNNKSTCNLIDKDIYRLDCERAIK